MDKDFKPIANMHGTGEAMLVQKAFPDAETRTVTVPKAFILIVDTEAHRQKHHVQVRFAAGVQEVPVFLLEPEMHWWLKANGVKVYEVARKENDEEKLTHAPTNAKPQPKVVLEDMTKAELMAYAEEHFELLLDGKLKKDEMIATIEDAEADIADSKKAS